MTAADHGTSNAPGRALLPLPAEVVAQIKSSTAIVSLSGVILELLKNALDAKASKVEATVDFARGACAVEDNGLGISPLEFRDEGGLGKLYCTSKHDTHEALLGRNGTFLASLSAVSLLSVTSRHHQHRSHNSVTFHHAKAIERQLPAALHHEIHGKHGTRVTVRNLFGNLPVRVKQRSKLLEQKAEHDRLWEDLKASVTGLLLSWAGSVSVRVRDADNRLIFNFNTSDSKQAARGNSADVLKPPPAQLVSMLNVLTQANYITVNEWATWIPVSASTPALSTRGAISLEPAPTKSVQFISLGVRPLTAEIGHNELYDQINVLFARSNFGAVDDGSKVDDLEKVRRSTDKRFKADGYTARQLTARKGVDKYPMFHLRVALRRGQEAAVSEERFFDNDSNLQAIVDLLSALVTQWLSAHHFRPAQPRQKRNQIPPPSTAQVRPESNSSSLESQTMPKMSLRSGTPSTLESSKIDTSEAGSRKRKRDRITSPNRPAGKLQNRAFAEWSRIKSGKSEFFSTETILPDRARGNGASSTSADMVNASPGVHIDQRRPATAASFITQPIPQGALNFNRNDESERLSQGTSVDSNEADDTILWTDPLTHKTHILNARTGCVMVQNTPKTITGSSLFVDSTLGKGLRTSLRLPPTSANSERKPWLDRVLKAWDNPIFQASEKRIEQVSLQERETSSGLIQPAQHRCSRFDMDKAFNGQLSSGLTKLSKKSLRGAEVVSQVDRKFILVKLKRTTIAATDENMAPTLLILIDQHAADERVQVEALFQELCAPTPSSAACPRYKSNLGHSASVASILLEKPIQFVISEQERSHFITYAERFAQWGILFDIADPLASSEPRHRLSVTSLPPSISERCKMDAAVLISFLRSTVWKYASNPHSVSRISTITDEHSPSWVKRLATCPEGLLDLVNSRACRTAIMFNDVLGLDECKRLVQNLAKCVFPFMCAHGRPSMVPLVDVATMEINAITEILDPLASNTDFVEAWKQWKR